MSSVHEHRGNAFMNNIDSTGAMVTKGGVAAGGTVASFSDTLQDATVFQSNVPWADVAAFLTCVYTSFLIVDWLFKKYRAYRENKKA